MTILEEFCQAQQKGAVEASRIGDEVKLLFKDDRVVFVKKDEVASELKEQCDICTALIRMFDS